MDECPIQGESKILIPLTLQKLELRAGSMAHLARKEFSLARTLAKVTVSFEMHKMIKLYFLIAKACSQRQLSHQKLSYGVSVGQT